MYIGIDPSFTRTGICIRSVKQDRMQFLSISKPDNNYQPITCLEHSEEIAKFIFDSISPLSDKNLLIAVEYPLMSSRSGAILAVLMAKIDSYLNLIPHTRIYFPPMAIALFTKTRNKSKSDLVNLFKQSQSISYKVNHDEVSAYYLSVMAELAIKGKYKNTFFTK